MPKIVAHCRKHPIPFLNTMSQTIPYLITLSRLSAPPTRLESSANQNRAPESSANQNRTLRHRVVNRELSAANQNRAPESSANQNRTLRHRVVTREPSAANQNRVLRHPGRHYGSVLNLAKASRLPVSKARQFSQSKNSFTKFTLATRKFKRMRAFAGFRNEFLRMDLAYVDKLAKGNNGVKYLLVRQDLFDRTVNAKGMKTKDSQETVKAFSSMITERNLPKKIWVDKGTEFAGAFKKFCSAEGIHVHSTMSETKAAFAERTMRSLKIIFSVTWKILGTSIYTNYLNLSLP